MEREPPPAPAPYAPPSEETAELITHLRDDVIPPAEDGTSPKVYVGGQTAIFDDFADVLTGKLPLFLTSGTALLALVVVLTRYGTAQEAAAIDLRAMATPTTETPQAETETEAPQAEAFEPTDAPATPEESQSDPDGVSLRRQEPTVQAMQETPPQQNLLRSDARLLLVTALATLTSR